MISMKTLVALGAVALALLAVLGGPRVPPDRPDIVVILIDTLRRDRLPFYGYSRPTAPFLSQLAASGTVFEHAYSTSAWTAPATASLHTSMYPFQHGVVMGRKAVRALQDSGARISLNRIPHAADTLAEVMQRAGYETFAVTQNANVTAAMGFDQGFASFNPVGGRAASRITNKLGMLRPQIRRSHPYFLYLHFMDVHGPYKHQTPFVDSNDDPMARKSSGYDNGIVLVDDHIRQAFERYRWQEGTVVFVVADHGEELGDHGNVGHAHNLYAETLNVPFFVYGLPGVPPGRRLAPRVSLIDILPTLRELAGSRPVATDEGVSLLPLLRGRTDQLPERSLFADLWRAPDGQRRSWQRATIRGPWKYIDGMTEGPLLFQLDGDPRDSQNRLGAYPEVAADLQRRFVRFSDQSRKFEPEFEETVQDAETNEELRALGYVN
jgi:arylsulfatase A-like enzyme